MPEGHLIHHYARAHATALIGPLAVSSPQGRFPEATELDGGELADVEAYGKHLFYWWRSGAIVHVHLGQGGLFILLHTPAPPARPQVRLRMAGAQHAVDLIAPIVCELTDTDGRDRVVARLGNDPLRTDAALDDVRRRLSGSGAAIGAVLLDQSVIAGVGNVLRAEVLNMARISPARPARSLRTDEVDRLWALLVEVMERAADEGRILTAAPDDPAERAALPQADGRFVYRQTHCRRCRTPVDESKLGGRTIYTCPRCQAP